MSFNIHEQLLIKKEREKKVTSTNKDNYLEKSRHKHVRNYVNSTI